MPVQEFSLVEFEFEFGKNDRVFFMFKFNALIITSNATEEI